MDDSTVDAATEKKKRLRAARKRNAKQSSSVGMLPNGFGRDSVPPPATVPASFVPPGAPIARATRSSSSTAFSKPGSPVDLRDANARQDDAAEELTPIAAGGRRSRAFHAPELKELPDRALKIVRGNNRFQPDVDADAESKTLSPSTATAIGDFAAAMVGPLAGAIYMRNVAVFIASALLVLLVRSQARRSALSEGEISSLSPVVASLGVLSLALAVDRPTALQQASLAAVAALAAGALAALILKVVTDRFVHLRVAVIGDAAAAHDLAWQLARAGRKRYTVLGYVTRTSEKDNLRELNHVSFKVRRLGLLADLSHVVARNDVDLLVMATDDDRLKIFERAAVCADRYRTRLISLTAFEEAVFRCVPVEQLNIAWFQHIMHPRFRPAPRAVTRAIDLAGAALLGLVTAPVWLLSAAIVKVFFGGPVMVRRRRVGERGRSFSVLRFRVAPLDEDGSAPPEDAEAAGFGRLLRRTRVEALPQLVNVLRGDLSLVGPQPQRPQLVSALETDVPFYGRRHLVRPGLTGWAQIHPLPGDEADPVATLSRDLFYLKHQSLLLYVFVLLSSIWGGLTGTRRSHAR